VKRAAILVAVACLLVAASCGDDGDGDSSQADGSTTEAPSDASTTTAAPAEVEELYPGHTPDLYAGTTNWICHPDLATSPCDDIRTTVVEADGTTTVDELEPAADPPFDCFYVYPTTSGDNALNSDLQADATEINTVIAQAARFGSVCRLYAPVYRSITLGAIGGGFTGDRAEARALAYGDVVDAWRTYADELNDGRGVVLIGHSQGAGHLQRLIDEEIGDDPDARARLVSAVLLGTAVDELPNVPPCESADEFGCLITYSSYPSASPPTEGDIFGRTTSGPATCVDPVALAGGNDLADAVLPARGTLLGGVAGFEDVATPFVALPGALTVECVDDGTYGFLGAALADPDDPRPVSGLLVELLGDTWGLHLLDGNLAQDDLIEVVARQAEAWAEGDG
jgi:hypothetical protein